MKKLLILLLVMAAALFCACDSESGSEHGVPYISGGIILSPNSFTIVPPATSVDVTMEIDAYVTDLDWDVKKAHVTVTNLTTSASHKFTETLPAMTSHAANYTIGFTYDDATAATYKVSIVFEDAGGRKSFPATEEFVVE